MEAAELAAEITQLEPKAAALRERQAGLEAANGALRSRLQHLLHCGAADNLGGGGGGLPPYHVDGGNGALLSPLAQLRPAPNHEAAMLAAPSGGSSNGDDGGCLLVSLAAAEFADSVLLPDLSGV